MITNLALPSRILPRLLRGLPTVTSVGYRMPHNRYFFAGISFSAALHAAVLFGFKVPVPPPLPHVTTDEILTSVRFSVAPDEPPPPPPEPGANKNDKLKANDAGEERASIPDLPKHPEPGSIELPVARLDPGKIPNPENVRWKVPNTPNTSSGTAPKDVAFRLIDLDKIPVATSRVTPKYPFELKHRGVIGTAVLRFVVDSRGNVCEVEVMSATEPEFGNTAADAMLKWKFNAGMKDGRRVSTRMEMPINFGLERDV